MCMGPVFPKALAQAEMAAQRAAEAHANEFLRRVQARHHLTRRTFADAKIITRGSRRKDR